MGSCIGHACGIDVSYLGYVLGMHMVDYHIWGHVWGHVYGGSFIDGVGHVYGRCVIYETIMALTCFKPST